MGEKKLAEPSEETKINILTFFLKTAVPRVIAAQKETNKKSS